MQLNKKKSSTNITCIRKCSICDSTKITYKFTIDNRHIVKCIKCGFVFVNEYDQVKLDKAYKENYYRSADDPNIEKWLVKNNAVWVGLTNFVLKFATIKISSILDIGSGCGGFLLNFHNRYSNAKLYAIEQSQEAKEFLNNKNKNITFIGDITEAQSKYKEKFDAITLFQVLEHFFDPKEKCKEIYSLLKPNGILYLTVPNIHSYLVLFKKANDGYCFSNLTHLSFFSSKDIKRLLTDCGFTEVKRIKMFGASNIKGYKKITQWLLRIIGISTELRFIAYKK